MCDVDNFMWFWSGGIVGVALFTIALTIIELSKKQAAKQENPYT